MFFYVDPVFQEKVEFFCLACLCYSCVVLLLSLITCSSHLPLKRSE